MSDYEREINTWTRTAPTTFRAGNFRITNLKEMRMALRHRKDSSSADTIYLFGQNPEQAAESPQIFLHSYELPAGKKAFQEELRLYRKQEKAFKLDGGEKFDPNLLNVEEVAPDYVHEAFQTRDGKSRRRIIHIYEAKDRAAIAVFSLNSAAFGSNTLFQTLVPT